MLLLNLRYDSCVDFVLGLSFFFAYVTINPHDLKFLLHLENSR